MGDSIPVRKALEREVLPVQAGRHPVGLDAYGNVVVGELVQYAVLQEDAVVQFNLDGAGFAAFRDGDALGEEFDKSGRGVRAADFHGIGDTHARDGIVDFHIQRNNLRQRRLVACLVPFHRLLFDGPCDGFLLQGNAGTPQMDQQQAPVVLHLHDRVVRPDEDGDDIPVAVADEAGDQVRLPADGDLLGGLFCREVEVDRVHFDQGVHHGLELRAVLRIEFGNPGVNVILVAVDLHVGGRLALAALGNAQHETAGMDGGFHHIFQRGDAEGIRNHEIVPLVGEAAAYQQHSRDDDAHSFHKAILFAAYQPGFCVKLVISANWALPKGKR